MLQEKRALAKEINSLHASNEALKAAGAASKASKEEAAEEAAALFAELQAVQKQHASAVQVSQSAVSILLLLVPLPLQSQPVAGSL